MYYPGFVGDSLADAFGVGSHEEAFAALSHTFGTGDPGEAFAQLSHAFGVHDCGLGAPPSPSGTTQLLFGQSLNIGQSVESPNRRTQLTMQRDGNLVLYDMHERVALWSAGTNGKGGAYAIMQPDGNFVVYNGQHQPVWASGTNGHPGAYLAIQDDGNVVVYAGSTALWSTKTGGYQKNFGGGFDLGNVVTSAVHDVGKATGLPADQVLNVAKNAGESVEKAVASGAKLVEKAGGDAGQFVADRAKAISKDPLGTLTQLATTGPMAIVGNPDDILKAIGLPTPSEMMKKIGIPPFTIPSPDEVANGITDPQKLLSHIPGLSQMAKFLPAMPNPTDYSKKIMSAVSTGDLNKIKSSVMDVGHQVADSMAMVPGIGDVISGPLAAAITAIESGDPLETSLELLLSQAPIPPDIKDLVLRPAIHGVVDVIEKHETVSDAFIAAFKEGIMAELKKQNIPEPAQKLIGDLVDAMVQVILKHKPLDQAAAGLAKKGLDTAISQATKQFGPLPGLETVTSALPSGLTNAITKSIPLAVPGALSAPPPPIVRGRLNAGQSIANNQSVTSPNGRTQLVMQADGNLAIYDLGRGHTAIWGSGTNGKGGVSAIMQPDGNFVVYNAQHQPVWASGTDNHPGAYVSVQDDGNVVVYAGTQPLWSSKTAGFKSNFGGGDPFGSIVHVVNDASKAISSVAKTAGQMISTPAGSDAAAAASAALPAGLPSLPALPAGLPAAVTSVTSALPSIPGLSDAPSAPPTREASAAEAVAKINSLQRAYQNLKHVGEKNHEIFQLTQGIIKLNKQDPAKTNPVIQKQIHDLRTSIEASKIHIHSHKQQLDTNLGRRLPHHLHRKMTGVPATPMAVAPPAAPMLVTSRAAFSAYPPYPVNK